jgi:phosphoribosylanthranilate isomerase
MIHTRVKVCGITTAGDAAACLAAGADHLGVIFARSTRRVTAERAKEIREAVPDASLVGVFAGEAVDRVADVARAAGLDMIQLHGGESPIYCEALADSVSTPIMKVLGPGQVADPENLGRYRAVCFFLFDMDKRSSNGIGAMRRLWAEAARAARRGRRVFLAGGLTPLNVREAVHQTAPFGVDVCRGVEQAPGVKDIDALMRFIAEVRR